MKPEKGKKRIVIRSVVGTLDLNIRYLLLGETFPGVSYYAYRFFFCLFLFDGFNPLITNNLCRNWLMLHVFLKSTEHQQADMVILQTYVFPNHIAARLLQATWCLLLWNMQNLEVI